MEDTRLANIFYEQRGPLVFSASVHLALLVVGAIWMMALPDKKPVEFNFELVPPPAGGFAHATQEQPLDALQEIKYESQPVEELPSLDDIVLPERPPIRVEIPAPPKPAPVERPQPTIEVEAPKPKPRTMTPEEFFALNPQAKKIQNVRTAPAPDARPKVDLTKDIAALRRSLSEFSIASLPSATIANYSLSEQAALSGYIASFKGALKSSVEAHAIRGAKLSALVRCDISVGGQVSNVRIVRSSGDAEFDRKVLAGYSRMSSFRLGPPPNGMALVGLEIEFTQ